MKPLFRHGYRFFILLFIFSGCASVPKKDLAQISEPISLNRSANDALETSDFSEGQWPKEQWWEVFNDPQLNALVELALKENPTLKKVYSQVEIANQNAKKERALLLPKLDMNYLEQWQYLSKYGFDRDFFPVPEDIQLPHTINDINLTLNFSYEFDFWGKNRNLFQAAIGQVRAMAAEASQAKLIITTSIVHAYMQLQANIAQLELLEERLDQRAELFELTASRHMAGVDPLMPVFQSEQNFYAVDQMILLLEQEIKIGKSSIKTLTGQGPDSEGFDLPLSSTFDRAFPLPNHLSSDLLARRPDLQAQIWRVESAAKEIGAAKADFYPNVNLSAFGGLESIAFRNLFKIGSRSGGLVPAIHLPIFTGGRLKANLKSKVAAFDEAVYAYNELLLQAAKEVSDQMVVFQTKNNELEVQFTNLKLVNDQFKLRRSRFEKGVSNYLSVLDMFNEVLDQRATYIRMRRDYLLSVVQLIKSLGGGYHSEFQPKIEVR